MNAIIIAAAAAMGAGLAGSALADEPVSIPGQVPSAEACEQAWREADTP